MKKKLLGLLSIIFIAVILVACGTKTFDVDFDLNGGTSAAIETQKVKKDGLVDEPTSPSRDGYIFDFWAEKESDDEWKFATSKVTKAITLVAQWEIKKYDVTFDAKGGAPTPQKQVVEHGAKASAPTVMAELEGNEFLGWFLSGATLPYNFDTKVTSNLVLEARWSLDEFTITFDLDGGEPAIQDKTVVYNGLVEKPADPTRVGSSFLGWYVDGEKYDFADPVQNDLTLQARWDIDYDVAINALIAYYEDTLGKSEWLAEDIELITEINFAPITWSSNNPDYFTNDGKVTKPTHSEGDQTIMLTAQLTPIKSHLFFFVVQALDQTTEEMLDEILRIVTIVPVSPSGFQETNFDVTNEYKIGEDMVPITWESSDETAMKANGELVPFEDASEKEVILTASITHDGVTRTREITFLLKGVTSYSSFKDALVSGNKGEKVRVEGVTYFTPIKANASSVSGYYVASEDNMIAFVYGNPPASLKKGKLYDVLFEVDIYFGSFQLKSVAFVNERDGVLPEIIPNEVTIDDIVNLPKPETVNFNHEYIKLTHVKVHVVDANDNYKTFLVDQDLDTETTPLNDMNSLMIYYVSNMEVIQNLDGKRIDEILLINNGYRSNNIVWYVNYIGDGSDIVMAPLTDAEAVVAAKEQLEGSIPFKVINENGITLGTEAFGAAISWTSSDGAVIDPATGDVTFATEAATVKVTASITLGVEELTFERDIWVGTPAQLAVSPIADVRAYDGLFGLMPFKVHGVVTGSTGDRSFAIYDGQNAVAIRTLSGISLDYGFEYTIVGYKALYGGLIQLEQSVEAVKGDAAALEEPIVLTEANLKDNTYLESIQAHLVSIDEAEITKIDVDSYGTYEITLKVGTAQIIIRWDNRVLIDQDAKDKLAELVVGDNVKIVGAALGWYNGPQLGYHTASQIMVAGPETDEDVVAAAIAALNIPQIANDDLELPTLGRFDANIVWTSSHPDVIAVDGTLTLPLENTTVVLTATVSFGTASEVVEYQVLVQVEEGVLNVKLARAVAIDEVAKFKGIVSGIANYESGDVKYIFLSDADGTTIALYNPTDAESLVLGDLVKVAGTRAAFNGLEQVTEATVIVLESEQTVPAATVLTEFPTFTADDQGKRYSIEGLTVVSASGRNLRVTDGTTEVLVYVDIDKEALTNHIATAAGKKVDLVNIHLGWYNSAQFLMFNTSEVVIAELTDQDKLDADKAALELAETYTEEHTLPVLGENGSVITWVADPAASLVDGKLVIPAEGEVEVTLTATIKLGELEDTKVFTVTLKELGEVEEELLYSIDFEGGTQNSYLRDVDTTLGVEGGLNWHIATEAKEKSGVLWNYNATQDTNITAEQGENIARLDGRNETTITSDAISNVTKLVFDAKFYGTRTDSNLKVQIKVGDGEFVDAFTVNLASTFNTFTVNINEENVQIRFVATGERSNLDNIRIYG